MRERLFNDPLMSTRTPHPSDRPLARRARERLVHEASAAMGEVRTAVLDRFRALVDEVSNAREMQERRDAWIAFQQKGQAWESGTVAAWQNALQVVGQGVHPRFTASTFELMGDEVVENKILSSRLGQAVLDRTAEPHADLVARLQMLEGSEDLIPQDPVRPEAMMLAVVEQWTVAGMLRAALPMVMPVLQREFTVHLLDAYNSSLAFLSANGVQAATDLRGRVKRSEGGTSSTNAAAWHDSTPPSDRSSAYVGGPRSGTAGLRPQPAAISSGAARGRAAAERAADEETRMMTVASPLARARRRAQGVMVHLKRVLTDHIGDFDRTVRQSVSPGLAHAIARKQDGGDTDPLYGTMPGPGFDYGMAVTEVAGLLRERTKELKKVASTAGEKATIEIVALMFQNILAEERIPPSIRVWFARLQLPVLRVALAEPEFFGTLDHPARQLIDRMGACVMGFDATAINGSAMETEIKRVVQVIEQYPETGRRVFQLVYDEFQQFLSRHLTEKGNTQRVVSLAQQVEQKETLAIQYTIELRKMLEELPVRDDIREFLFKVWAEVLAMAAVRSGPQHADTISLKKAASELVWAASAKPNRAERAQVIESLPALLQRLRHGMGLLGLQTSAQEAHIKIISDTLADAFMSKTEAIPQARIESMAARLANLEDFVSDENMGDLPLDAENIELMLGIDASSLDVITDGGSKPTEAMMAWAQDLTLGQWFMLDHNNRVNQVQFAWRSNRKQLHLFAAMDGRSYLIQMRRLAAYLQAGLLVPQEEEALTLRATRDALAKLDANPERLLG